MSKELTIEIIHCEDCPKLDRNSPWKGGTGVQCTANGRFFTEKEWEDADSIPEWCPLDDAD